MKKTRKILASLGIVAAVAGVGVMAAGCGDEFANAETIKYQDFATFQTEAENEAVNVIDGGTEVNFEMGSNSEEGNTSLKLHAKVQKLAQNAAPEAVANMAFTIDYHAEGEMAGITMDLSYYVDVTVVTEKVENVDTVNVYFTMNSKKYKTNLQELEAIIEGLTGGNDMFASTSPYSAILQYVEMLNQVPSMLEIPQSEDKDTTYKKVVSGDTTKFQIQTVVGAPEDPVEEYEESTNTLQLSYNKKQLTEYTLDMLSTEKDKEGKALYSTTEKYEVKGFEGEIKAPNNADKYEELSLGM